MSKKRKRKRKRKPVTPKRPALSAIMIEFAQEILAQPLEMTSGEGAHCALALAQVAWNREIEPDGIYAGAAQYLQLLATFEADNPQARADLASYDCEALIEQLRRRKRERYPDDDRLIHVCGTTPEGNVHVEWTSESMEAARLDSTLRNPADDKGGIAGTGFFETARTICSRKQMGESYRDALAMSAEEVAEELEQIYHRQPYVMRYCFGLPHDGVDKLVYEVTLRSMVALYDAFTAGGRRPMAVISKAEFEEDFCAVARAGEYFAAEGNSESAAIDVDNSFEEPWAIAVVMDELRRAMEAGDDTADLHALIHLLATIKAFHREANKVRKR